ncbi:hypothetical protein NP233_g13095 [Leucocoprinus birnbaumii]|uniref:Uncharacterized protein n=1 Tax=Leucocoprinus birnbaumii TaxID=56174 RepID=A0AAD5YIW7_9AGAR|nr:hypothetical protein NP233_g13095 [Leucocoprinus birnbaumii]
MGRSGQKRARGRAEKHSPSEKKKGKAAVLQLLAAVDGDLEACSLLAVATTPEACEAFCSHVKRVHVPPNFPKKKLSGEFFHQFASWAGQLTSTSLDRQPPFAARNIPAAYAYRSQKKKDVRWSKQHFIETAGLNWKAVDKDAFLSGIPSFTAKALPDCPYPPPEVWITETKAIKKLNRKHFHEEDLHDNRDRRRPFMHLDASKLQLDIKPTESARIYDDDGNLIMMVVRNACKNPDALRFADAAVERILDMRTTSRKGDAGHLPMFGLSAGSLSGICLDWVKNLKSKRTSQTILDEAEKQGSSAFALFYNLFLSIAPSEVIDDFNDHLSRLGNCRMDARGTMSCDPSTGEGNYTVDLPGYSFTFHGAQLAPPTSVCARNYARYTHREHQPHKYSVSWTTTREIVPSIPDALNGGHFFLASHGIRIQAAANTMMIWQPKMWHGTSLPHQHPTEPTTEFCQRGLAFVTSSRLPRAWELYCANKLSQEAAEAWLLDHEPLDESGDPLPSEPGIELSLTQAPSEPLRNQATDSHEGLGGLASWITLHS